MTLGKTDTEADTHHADHMICTDVTTKDRTSNGEPTQFFAGKEVVLGRFFLATSDQSDNHCSNDRGEKNGVIADCKL